MTIAMRYHVLALILAALSFMVQAWAPVVTRCRAFHHFHRRTSQNAIPGSSCETEDISEHHPLIHLGALFLELDESVGNPLIRAGQAWESNDWGGTTEALARAAKSLQERHEEEGPDDTQLWQAIAAELEDISGIEGCSSVGPPASIPNWISIQELLVGNNKHGLASAVLRLVDSI